MKDATYNLQRGAKVGLLGRNGTGKSTLLKILAEEARSQGNALDISTGLGAIKEANYRYTGTVTVPKTVSVSIVDQEPPMPSDVTVGDAVLGITNTDLPADYDSATNSGQANKNLMEVVRRYRVASRYAAKNPDFFSRASADMDEVQGGWDVLTKAEEISSQLKVLHLQDKPLALLSGGERKRVALCAALVEEPDVLLLDEPTNFLSLAGVEYLSQLLKSPSLASTLTVLMVTHDRAFMEEVCDRILELDRGSLYEHSGSYRSFLEAKEQRLAAEDAEVRSAKAKYRVELEWMRRQPQARETKQKARMDAFYKLEKATKPRPRDPNLNLIQQADGGTRRIGGTILSMKHVTLKFDDRIMLDDFDYDFCKGDRICLAGANGVGKTTFTKLLTGELTPNSGEIEVGDTIVLGNYDQLGLKFDETAESQTVLEFVVDQVAALDMQGTGMSQTPAEARRLLNQFEFPRSRWNERVSILSGGERRRLQLLSVLSKKPNFLILDEPSVDCDLDTLSAIEAYLEKFEGVLIVVSHDRAFADKVTDHLFIFEGDGVVKDFQGSLSEYATVLVDLETKQIEQSSSSDGTLSVDAKKESVKQDRETRNRTRNLIRSHKKEILNLERAIEKLKPKAAEVQQSIDSTSSDEGWSVLADLTEQLNSINEEMDEKEMRWLEIAEELETLEADDL